MTHILKNENLEIEIDDPLENYNFSRFDWTGKITSVKFRNISFSTRETTDYRNENVIGKGFYNEFGIDTPLGFKEAEIGGWFHKIGVGLLKKHANEYLFNKDYEIKPANFTVYSEPNKCIITCKSESINGYSYILTKEIALFQNSFTIQYCLENTGEKDIITNEYVHNFVAVNNDNIDENYTLKFPFQLQPELFEETVNPENKVALGIDSIAFNSSPKEQFFFSNLSGGKSENAQWELLDKKNKVAIRETGSFKTNKVNLWGWKHVISPELFFNINIKSGSSTKWSRNYEVFTSL